MSYIKGNLRLYKTNDGFVGTTLENVIATPGKTSGVYFVRLKKYRTKMVDKTIVTKEGEEKKITVRALDSKQEGCDGYNGGYGELNINGKRVPFVIKVGEFGLQLFPDAPEFTINNPKEEQVVESAI